MTMGPEPMMRIVWMSVRRGIGEPLSRASFDQLTDDFSAQTRGTVLIGGGGASLPVSPPPAILPAPPPKHPRRASAFQASGGTTGTWAIRLTEPATSLAHH